MATFTATASSGTTMGYTTYDSSNWSTGNGAYQGIYNESKSFTETLRRVGVMTFNGAGAALKGKIISDIAFSMTFSGSGHAYSTKQLMIRKSNYQSLDTSLVANAYPGDLMAAITGKYYNNTVKLAFNESTNAEAFALMKKYFEKGNSQLVLFDEGTTQYSSTAYTTNFLRCTSCTMTVTYEEGGLAYMGIGDEWVAGYAYAGINGEYVRCMPYVGINDEYIQT